MKVRFSSKDSFRSDLVDLLGIYRTVKKLGVNCIDIADTVDCDSLQIGQDTSWSCFL